MTAVLVTRTLAVTLVTSRIATTHALIHRSDVMAAAWGVAMESMSVMRGKMNSSVQVSMSRM